MFPSAPETHTVYSIKKFSLVQAKEVQVEDNFTTETRWLKNETEMNRSRCRNQQYEQLKENVSQSSSEVEMLQPCCSG